MLQNNPQNAQIVTHRNQLADNYRKIGALYGSKSTKIEEKWKTTQACRERLMHHLPPIQTAQIDLLISFRKEIGFEFDEARYATFMKSQAAEAMKFAGAFTKEINSSVAAKME